ncbi:TMEM175 family protein [Fulvivirga imtechensis]|nr:TMEM175 family protein [Fulvivirga imtechensis]
MNKEFRFRGKEQTRIETFSDAVFALAITMLIVSTEMPKDFTEMLTFVADLLPFGLCMALIVYIWYEHFQFFIRYGFRNPRIVVFNAMLLFVVLFYVYPLKFLAKLLVVIYSNIFMSLFGYERATLSGVQMISNEEMPQLMIIYGLGAALVFAILTLMYKYALKKSEELELNEIEMFDTRTSLYTNIIMGSVPLLSVLFAWIFSPYWFSSIISGFTYMLYPGIFAIYGSKRGRKRKLLVQRLGL